MRYVVLRTIVLLTFVAFQLTVNAVLQVAEAAPQKNFTIVQISSNAGELTPVLKAEVRRAKQLGQKPFVYVYAEWCSPCRALRNSLDDPLMIDAFKGTYIVLMEAKTWGKILNRAGFSTRKIPVIYEINNEGNPTGRKIDGDAWGDNIPKNMAPPLKAFFRGQAQK